MDNYAQIRDRLRTVCPQLELREQEPLRRHTSFRIGGPVPLMALPKTQEEASLVMEVAEAFGISPFFLGKGSNLLVSDAGADAFVMKCCIEELALLSEDSFFIGSGASLAQGAVFAMEQGLSGMEFAHGIPGSLGGAVFMNAGAYGGEMAQIVTWVDCISRAGRLERLRGEALQFGYRHSVFSDETRFILGAALRLAPGEGAQIKETMMELMQRRKSKQPLEFPSAGSTFRRPPGQFAGTLIEGCGLKGAKVGGAKVSEKHAGFVINTGGATCEDVLRLMTRVRERVQRETGILLEPEVRMLGCSL